MAGVRALRVPQGLLSSTRQVAVSITAGAVRPVLPSAGIEQSRRRVFAVAAVMVISGVVFAALEAVMISHDNQVLQARAAAHGLHMTPPSVIVPALVGLARWAAMTAGTLMVQRRNPRLALLPLAAFILTPLLLPPPGAGARLPGTLGAWAGPLASPSRMWLGAATDAALVVAPLIAARLTGRRRERAVPARPDSATLAALICSGVAIWLVLYFRDLVVGLGASRSDLPAVAALFLIAAAAPVAGAGDTVMLAVVTVFLGSSVLHPILQGQLPSWSADLVPALPEAAATVAGLCWRPLRAGIRRLQQHPPASVALAVNALNIADAVLTRFDLHHLHAIEANPVVRLIGWPVKLVVVAAATWYLHKMRPKALVWPLLALAGVIAWHLGGIIVGHR